MPGPVRGVPMPQVQLLRVVVASPSDVQAERNALESVIEELNTGVARDRDLRLLTGVTGAQSRLEQRYHARN